MINQALLKLLESVLGQSQPTARGNYAFICPNGCHPSKPKLEVCIDPNSSNTKGEPIYQHYGCWICKTRGKKIKNLIKTFDFPASKLEELYYIIDEEVGSNYKFNPNFSQIPQLPEEYKSLSDIKNLTIEGKHALNYLINERNLTLFDIKKYNLGYCEAGRYEHRIIFPSYDKDENLNYFISRTYKENEPRTYNFPPLSRDIIFYELFINWDLPIILCEGVLDSIALKRNTIPLLGTTITQALMKKLVESKVNKIYLVLDRDAIKKSIEYCEMLMNEGKKIYFVDLKDKDPSKIGFTGMLDVLYNTVPFTFRDLLKLKLEI